MRPDRCPSFPRDPSSGSGGRMRQDEIRRARRCAGSLSYRRPRCLFGSPSCSLHSSSARPRRLLTPAAGPRSAQCPIKLDDARRLARPMRSAPRPKLHLSTSVPDLLSAAQPSIRCSPTLRCLCRQRARRGSIAVAVCRRPAPTAQHGGLVVGALTAESAPSFATTRGAVAPSHAPAAATAPDPARPLSRGFRAHPARGQPTCVRPARTRVPLPSSPPRPMRPATSRRRTPGLLRPARPRSGSAVRPGHPVGAGVPVLPVLLTSPAAPCSHSRPR